MTCKYAIVIANGAADEPAEALGGRTPLEAANIPNIDGVVSEGRQGMVRTIPAGFAAGSDVAVLSLLGYDVHKCYTGRAPIEAVAQNIRLGHDEVVFRCNLVTVVDGELVDHAGGHIRTAEARQVIDALNAEFSAEPVRFHAGLSYRHLMVISDSSVLDTACIPPDAIQSERAADYTAKGPGAERINAIARRASAIAASHDVNLVREDLEEMPANAVWLWGQGVTPILPRFRRRFGVVGAVVGAVDLMRGLAKLAGLAWADVAGASGDLGTDTSAKGRAAVDALDENDLVVVHVEAPGEAALMGDVDAKVEALERIDADIVGPLLGRLREYDQWRILIAPDHVATTAGRRVVGQAVPFCMAGPGVPRGLHGLRFGESVAAATDFHIERGCELMEFFLRR
ncbi:MAG: 2,3-bisphosphoglycerate-independent phosphoglycerate mutase [Phycisphaerae bacterium]